MQIGSILAIYTLFWVLSLFIVLPLGICSTDEAGVERQPGHADGAPHMFNLGRAALRATLLSALLFALFYANYHYGWVGIAALDWAAPPRP